jgi:hypothetical protein
MTDPDLHLALCVVKIFALLVIASSLWSISVALRPLGYLSDGTKETSVLGRSYLTIPQPNSGDSAAWLGPSRNSQTSQAPFGNRYEPPVEWNSGDYNLINQMQQANVVIPEKDMTAVEAGTGNFLGIKTKSGNFLPSPY